MKALISSAGLGLIIALAGCDAPTAGNGEPASATLSFMVGDNSALSKSLSGHVALSSAKLLLKTIQFHSVDDGDSLDFRSDAVVVDLDLTGALNTLEPIDIPMGEYNKVSFRLHKPGDGEDVGDPDFVEGESGSDRYSVVVAGTRGDSSFVFKSRRTANQRVEFDPPLVISDTTGQVNVTLSVDVNSWFIDKNSGAALDPTNPDDESSIDNAITESFKGFVDNDKRGGN